MSKASVTTSRQLISNTAWNMAGLMLNAVVGFLLIGFLLGRLGQAQYGLWILVGSVFRYRGILSMGLNNAVNRFVPMQLAQDDDKALQRTISTALGFYFFMACVFLLLTLILRHFIGAWFAINPSQLGSARLLVLIVGLGFTLVLPLQLATAVLSGCQRYDLVNQTVLVALGLRTILLVTLLSRGYGLLTMGILFASSEIGARLVQWVYINKRLPKLRLRYVGLDGPLLREMLGYGGHTFLYVVGGIAAVKVCDLVIGASSLGMEGVARFSIAATAVLLLTQLLQAFTQAVMPAVSDLSARQSENQVREMAFLAQKYSLMLLIPSVCFLVVMGRPFLSIWVGQKINDAGVIDTMAQVLTLLALGHGLRLVQHSNFQVLVGRGQHQFFGRLMTWTTASIVVLSIGALWGLDLGLLGVAWANFIPMTVFCGIVLPVYVARQMQMSGAEIWQRVWSPAFRSSLPSLLVIGGWRYWVIPQTWPQLLSAIATMGSFLLLGIWCWGLAPVERQRFTRLLVRREDPIVYMPKQGGEN